jgi:voltage-gated potassium channel Kch
MARRLRDSWREVRRPVLVSATLVTVVLAAWGFAEARVPDRRLGWTDIAYEVPRLFVWAGGLDPTTPVPWQLNVARFLAPLLAGYAAILGLLALFREELTILRARLLTRQHVLICGLGRAGFLLAVALNDAGQSVVVVESDRTNESLQGCRERAIPVIMGDASDAAILRRAAAGMATHVVVCCGADGVNLDVLGALRNSWSGLSRPPVAHVHVADHALWHQLESAALTSRANGGLRAEFFNLPQMVARALVAHRPAPWRASRDRPFRVLVLGARPVVSRVCASVAARTVSDRCVLDLVVAYGDGAAREPDETEPDLDPIGLARVWDVSSPTALAASGGSLPEPIDEAFICAEPEGRGLAHALALAALSPDINVTVLASHGALADECGALPGGERIAIVDAVRLVLSPGLLRNTMVEILARARHEQYLRDAWAREKSAGNPSAVPWDALPEDLKDSNRHFAESISVKLRQLGQHLAPLPLLPTVRARPSLDCDVVEALAQSEHKRWMTDRIAAGWQPTTGPEDPTRRLHPSLVPWDALSDREQEKDREAIRELPDLLAIAGYMMRPAPERPSSPRRWPVVADESSSADRLA